jgi:hypothetical protein
MNRIAVFTDRVYLEPLCFSGLQALHCLKSTFKAFCFLPFSLLGSPFSSSEKLAAKFLGSQLG